MDALIKNTRTNEVRLVEMLEWHGGNKFHRWTLEDIADNLLKRIATKWPNAYKVVFNKDSNINIMAGNPAKCIFEIYTIFPLKDSDDSFLC